MAGHITPETFNGGPIALVKDGDTITIDAMADINAMDVTNDELKRRWRTRRLTI